MNVSSSIRTLIFLFSFLLSYNCSIFAQQVGTHLHQVSPNSQKLAALGNVTLGDIFQGAPLPTSPYILNYSETGNPGDVINLQGPSFLTSSVYLQPIGQANSTPIQLPFLSVSYNGGQVQIPQSLANGIYKVYTSYEGKQSNAVYINQADVTVLDSDIATPGGSINAYGRNLQGPNSELIFVDSNGDQYFAPGSAANQFIFSGTVPSNIPSGQYTVYFTNGLAGNDPSMWVKVPETVTIMPAEDPLNLGLDQVHWASVFSAIANNVIDTSNDPRLANNPTFKCGPSDLSNPHTVGDGVADDEPAIRCAIQLANYEGGGEVHLRAGIYNISSESTHIYSNVVVVGDGSGPNNGTTIVYGNGNWAFTVPQSGASNLGFVNLSLTDTPQGTPSSVCTQFNGNGQGALGITNLSGQPQSHFIMDNVNISYCNNYNALIVQGYDEVAIENSTIDSRGPGGGGLGQGAAALIPGNSHISVINNVMNANNGRTPYLDNTYRGLVKGNTFQVFENYWTLATNTGGPQIGISQDLVLDKDIMNNIGTSPYESQDNSDEAINIENTFPGWAGTITSSSPNTICDSTQNFPDLTQSAYSSTYVPGITRNVSIMNGSGLGETLPVASSSSNCVTVAGTWPVVPAPGSEYAINYLASNNVSILESTFDGFDKAAEAYSGSRKFDFSLNTTKNSVGLLLNGAQMTPGPASFVGGKAITQDTCAPEWFPYVYGNDFEVTDNSDPTKDRGQVMAADVQGGPNRICIPLLGVEIRDNTVSGLDNYSGAANGQGTYTPNNPSNGLINYSTQANGFILADLNGSLAQNDGEHTGIALTIVQGDSCSTNINPKTSCFFQSWDADQTAVTYSPDMTVFPANMPVAAPPSADDAQANSSQVGTASPIQATSQAHHLSLRE